MNEPATTTRMPRMIARDDGRPFSFGGVGGRWKISGSATDDRFAVAHLVDIPPGVLGAPPHRHENEDEYSLVLAGEAAVLLEDEVILARAGTWVEKPRGLWHTFWNAGQAPCTIAEIVSPAGFEGYFREIGSSDGSPDALRRINERYAIDMDMDRARELCEHHGLEMPDPRTGHRTGGAGS